MSDLDWIDRLPEVGTLRGRIKDLADHDAEIEKAKAHLAALRRGRKELIQRAEKDVARQWTPAEVAAAKGAR